ncbi:winged helix-turn-helix domain-containing protein [Acidianus manzaensis]|uniref:ArsR family transcriptional regulator n=1 Tax=Acidianus manzaensis TaxID=282676 RepID=A0A1W6JWT5_9CREN|nr:winged helix-turn-helix domain-containing protein [Acidianus manzaensis]ARM74715.1 hypothetical protein B6F84_00870 [Acidianus manzaensis]
MDKRVSSLPCSAKLVYKVLEMKKKLTFNELKEETYLPERTLREALKILKEKGLIETEVCLKDTRSRYYILSETECYEIDNKNKYL